MILLTGFYRDADPARHSEFLECVERNCANPQIECIHLFLEDAHEAQDILVAHPRLVSPKVQPVPHGRRLTYRDLFEYANRHLAGRRVIIANADIFFDRTLARLEGYDLSGRLLCLSRWDSDSSGTPVLFDFSASQDAWIFAAPLPPIECDFSLGVPGCDNRLAWEAATAGLIVSNPSRSLRACHVHASQVRRYTEQQRLSGPIRCLPPELLGTPWLWFIIPCKGCLETVRQTMDGLLAQPRSSWILVDYDCPQGSGDWARRVHPDVRVVTAGPRSRFHGAEARNLGAAAADDDAVLCFLDADLDVAPNFSTEILSLHQAGAFLVPDRDGPGRSNVLVCSKADFIQVGGFDEAFQDTGEEVADLRGALLHAGLKRATFPASLLSLRAAGTGDDSGGQRALVKSVHAAYGRAKAAVLDETGGGGIATATRRELYAAIFLYQACALAQECSETCAAIAFREDMGYTVERLVPGVSSHNNEPHPFAAIPGSLAGRYFTQVVAYRVSPVQIEFLAGGKLYLLVGTDWYGAQTALSWLRTQGQAEILPPVRTHCGISFEVWSLVRSAGERLTLPTQVMLVADRLLRM